MQGVTTQDVTIQNITTQCVRIKCVTIQGVSTQVSKYRFHNTGVTIGCNNVRRHNTACYYIVYTVRSVTKQNVATQFVKKYCLIIHGVTIKVSQ